MVGCKSTSTSSEVDGLGYQGFKHSDSSTPKAIQLLNELKNNPNAVFSENNGWVIVNVKSADEMSLYSFTPESHSAYPSIVKREVLQDNDAVYIDTSVTCGSAKEICDQLVKDFLDLNNNVQQQMQK